MIDVSKVSFIDSDTSGVSYGNGIMLYFRYPLELAKKEIVANFTNAVSATISVSIYAAKDVKTCMLTASMSPTVMVDDDCYEDVDWVTLEEDNADSIKELAMYGLAKLMCGLPYDKEC